MFIWLNNLFKSEGYLTLTTIFIFITFLLLSVIIFTPQDELAEAFMYSSVIIVGFATSFLITKGKTKKYLHNKS